MGSVMGIFWASGLIQFNVTPSWAAELTRMKRKECWKFGHKLRLINKTADAHCGVLPFLLLISEASPHPPNRKPKLLINFLDRASRHGPPHISGCCGHRLVFIIMYTFYVPTLRNILCFIKKIGQDVSRTSYGMVGRVPLRAHAEASLPLRDQPQTV